MVKSTCKCISVHVYEECSCSHSQSTICVLIQTLCSWYQYCSTVVRDVKLQTLALKSERALSRKNERRGLQDVVSRMVTLSSK